jgi:hypothetical protein
MREKRENLAREGLDISLTYMFARQEYMFLERVVEAPSPLKAINILPAFRRHTFRFTPVILHYIEWKILP